MKVQDRIIVGSRVLEGRVWFFHLAWTDVFGSNHTVSVLTEPIWEVTHEYDELAVPRIILHKMRDVEGVTEEPWNKGEYG